MKTDVATSGELDRIASRPITPAGDGRRPADLSMARRWARTPVGRSWPPPPADRIEGRLPHGGKIDGLRRKLKDPATTRDTSRRSSMRCARIC
jgi:hypothetical protein